MSSKTPVGRLIDDLVAGRITLDQAVERLPRVVKPGAGAKKPARTVDELYAAELADELPETEPGTFDEVYDAYGRLTREQHEALHHAMGEAKRLWKEQGLL